MGKGFDEYAPAYDAWFLENRNVLYSEINLVAHVLKNPGRTLSVGCGSGLFETILAKEYGITITTASNRRKEWPKSPASGG